MRCDGRGDSSSHVRQRNRVRRIPCARRWRVRARPVAPSAAILLSVGGLMLALMALQAEARRRARRASEGDPHTLEHHQLEVAADGIRAWC